MTALRREHTARRRYHCDWECGEPIEPGTRYVRTALTPQHDDLDNERWWTHRGHGPTHDACPARIEQRVVIV